MHFKVFVNRIVLFCVQRCINVVKLLLSMAVKHCKLYLYIVNESNVCVYIVCRRQTLKRGGVV